MKVSFYSVPPLRALPSAPSLSYTASHSHALRPPQNPPSALCRVPASCGAVRQSHLYGTIHIPGHILSLLSYLTQAWTYLTPFFLKKNCEYISCDSGTQALRTRMD